MARFSHGKVLCVINLSAAVKSSLVVFILMIINVRLQEVKVYSFRNCLISIYFLQLAF